MAETRPTRLVVVVGTGTEVGKTWLAVRLLQHLRSAGNQVAARKPAQSFDPNEFAPTDADLLGAATGEHPHTVCPEHRWYPVAMAPPMAADSLGLPPISLAELVPEIRWDPGTDTGIVETAGGLASPIAHDGDNVDLLNALEPDRVVLVADAGLGTINVVRLALGVLADRPTLVFLNRFDEGNELHRRNLDWLQQRDHAPVTTDPSMLVRFD